LPVDTAMTSDVETLVPTASLRQLEEVLDRGLVAIIADARQFHGLVTRVDLPGMKKDDLTVEVTDGHLALSGQRKRETEEKKDNIYRSEREYGDFYRLVPLPDGVTLADVKATFADGVLEVSVPLPTRVENTVRKVPIDDVKPAAKSAA